MHWTGLILMDCWGGGWHDRCAKSQQCYQRIIDTIDQHQISVDHIVEACYRVHGDFTTDVCFLQIPCGQRHRSILDWPKFCDASLNHGAWLLAGQSWNQCIHQRLLGVMMYADNYHVRCQLYSHPDLVDHAPGVDAAVLDQDFAQDPRVSWESRPLGFWRVQHPRYRPRPWL